MLGLKLFNIFIGILMAANYVWLTGRTFKDHPFEICVIFQLAVLIEVGHDIVRAIGKQ